MQNGLVVDPALNRNEYQEYYMGGRGGHLEGLTTLPPSCGDCLIVWEPHTFLEPSGSVIGLYRDCFTFTLVF